MKLAHILPLSIIDTTPSAQTVHLALAPLVIRHHSYANFLRQKLRYGHTVIVDNPVHEDGPIDPVTWLSAIRSLRADKGTIIAVIPDVIDDDSTTVKQAITYAPMVRGLGAKLMAVPHGVENHDFFECARKLVTVPGVTHLGISLERRLKNDELAYERRFDRLAMIRRSEALDSVRIHLLGTSERAYELCEDSNFWSRADSTDTSKFAVFALRGIPQTPPAPLVATYPGRKELGGSMSYFDHVPKFRPYGKYNFTRNLALWNNYAERKNR